MADSLELPAIYVEGDTDKHTIIHLLARHGIVLDKDLGPVVVKQGQLVQNDQGVLDAMATAVRASTNRSVGFVVDANGAVAHRWRAICNRLKGIDLALPAGAPADGFIGDSMQLKTRVGVWIMPDNITDAGNLEGLVSTLVPENDTLISHAGQATDQAIGLGAGFPSQDRAKAFLHCWLAWQKEPGMSFGLALKAHYFRHDSEVALRFVQWFIRLFELG